VVSLGIFASPQIALRLSPFAMRSQIVVARSSVKMDGRAIRPPLGSGWRSSDLPVLQSSARSETWPVGFGLVLEGFDEAKAVMAGPVLVRLDQPSDDAGAGVSVRDIHGARVQKRQAADPFGDRGREAHC
jgi:hypothetical protein